MQSQAQFTPEQLIVAGRRAEQQGQPAYALQFYRYIAEHFPSTTEAYEARDAIYRLTPPLVEPQPPPPQQSYANGYAQPAVASATKKADVRPAPSLEAGPGPSHGRPVGGKAERKRRKAEAEADSEIETSTGSAGSGPRYRIGRFVAVVLSTMGWLMLIGGLLMGPAMLAGLTVKTLPKGLRETIANNLLAVGGIMFGMLFLGLFAIFASQAARATFDTAEAVRHLLDRPPPDA